MEYCKYNYEKIEGKPIKGGSLQSIEEDLYSVYFSYDEKNREIMKSFHNNIDGLVGTENTEYYNRYNIRIVTREMEVEVNYQKLFDYIDRTLKSNRKTALADFLMNINIVSIEIASESNNLDMNKFPSEIVSDNLIKNGITYTQFILDIIKNDLKFEPLSTINAKIDIDKTSGDFTFTFGSTDNKIFCRKKYKKLKDDEYKLEEIYKDICVFKDSSIVTFNNYSDEKVNARKEIYSFIKDSRIIQKCETFDYTNVKRYTDNFTYHNYSKLEKLFFGSKGYRTIIERLKQYHNIDLTEKSHIIAYYNLYGRKKKESESIIEKSEIRTSCNEHSYIVKNSDGVIIKEVGVEICNNKYLKVSIKSTESQSEVCYYYEFDSSKLLYSIIKQRSKGKGKKLNSFSTTSFLIDYENDAHNTIYYSNGTCTEAFFDEYQRLIMQISYNIPKELYNFKAQQFEDNIYR